MKLVVDTNRVISAVLRDGPTRELLFSTGAELFAPMALREELDLHLNEIVARAGGSRQQILSLLNLIFRRITWVGDSILQPFLAPASAALRPRDPGDVAFLACALAIGADAIWSHDKDFDAQSLVLRVTNEDVKRAPD